MIMKHKGDCGTSYFLNCFVEEHCRLTLPSQMWAEVFYYQTVVISHGATCNYTARSVNEIIRSLSRVTKYSSTTEVGCTQQYNNSTPVCAVDVGLARAINLSRATVIFQNSKSMQLRLSWTLYRARLCYHSRALQL